MIRRTWVDRGPIIAVALAVLAVAAPTGARAQDAKPRESQRERALRLSKDHDHEPALPLLEKLAEEDPKDMAVLSALGESLVNHSATFEEEVKGRPTLIRAREVLLRARDLGDDSDLTNYYLAVLRPDGSRPPFSGRKEIHEAIAKGEAAFARKKFDEAIPAYQRALTLDPTNYHAALFIGDCYFAQKAPAEAQKWFERTTKIGPNHETAYRYWGDALMIAGKPGQARARFIDAIVAEPYNRRALDGFVQWANNTGTRLRRPAIFPPGPGNDDKPPGEEVIDPKNLRREDGTARWGDYAKVRAEWKGGKYLKENPDTKAYRHSLAEEAEALRALAEGVASDVKDGTITKLDPALAELLKIRDAGLLEAHILLDTPDRGIAEDYPAYRASHRDALRRLITEYHIQE